MMDLDRLRVAYRIAGNGVLQSTRLNIEQTNVLRTSMDVA